MTLPELARKSIEYFLKKGKYLPLEDSEIPEEFRQAKAGAFVSLHEKNGDLRGCIGTFEPTKKSVAEEVIHNAVSAALGDPRFYAVQLHELPELNISVDVLENPEPVKTRKDLNAKDYGVIVKTADGKCGLLLPDIEGVETCDQQLEIACSKAGIAEDEKFDISRFKVTRYH